MSMVVHYNGDGEGETHVPTITRIGPPDQDPGVLAEGLDATIDATAAALTGGNVDQAEALLGAADNGADALLDALGRPDADDPSVA